MVDRIKLIMNTVAWCMLVVSLATNWAVFTGRIEYMQHNSLVTALTEANSIELGHGVQKHGK